MNIVPISSMAILNNSPIANTQNRTVNDSLPFQDMFMQAFRNFEETRAVSDADRMRIATGDVDNIAEIMINAERADVAMQMAIQLRNRILESYQELMRMNI